MLKAYSVPALLQGHLSDSALCGHGDLPTKMEGFGWQARVCVCVCTHTHTHTGHGSHASTLGAGGREWLKFMGRGPTQSGQGNIGHGVWVW